MPKEKKPNEERSPEQTAALARDVMSRMLAMPPKPHVPKKQSEKKSKSRQK